MNMKEYVRQVLSHPKILDSTADKKVYFLHANNAKVPYIEYEIIDEYGVFHAEGKEKSAAYLIQVDIFSTTDYTKLEENVMDAMINAGFHRDFAADQYEEDTRLYHKAMRFSYYRTKEE